jgi:hypothetical protein
MSSPNSAPSQPASGHHASGHHAGAANATLSSTKVTIEHGAQTISVSVPARHPDEAHQTLSVIGQGGLGTGLHNTYLGLTLPKIRSAYYEALRQAESEISARRLALGTRLNNPMEFRQFVKWAAERRTSIARLYRVPAGAGAVIGGEIRDIRKYGPGGRTFDNLMARNAQKGLTETESLERILATVDKPNPAETEAILKGAKFLRGGGTVFFVGGVALMGYEWYRARPEDRPELVKKDVITTGSSIVATDLAVGVAFMLGATGVGLIAVGIVAGVAAAYGAESLYYAHQH